MSALDELFGLSGKVAVVTGASSGLGVVMARALAKAGADVALVARRKDRLDAVAARARGAGRRALAVPADVTDEKALDAAVARIEAELGPIYVLVNAAGVSPLGRAEKHTREKWDSALAVNLTAVFLASQAVGQAHDRGGSGGRIIQISSVIAQGANPVHQVVGYAASKGAVNNLTRQLAVEWASTASPSMPLPPAISPRK